MSETIVISPTGRINRRDKANEIEDDQVLSRENFMVIGAKNKKIKKVSGSDRLNSTAISTKPFVWGTRYYSKISDRHTFGFNQDGALYFIDDLGNTTQLISTFDPTAYPCSAQMRVSEQDILFFSEGKNTGMYSYDGNTSYTFTKEIAVTKNFVGMVPFLDRLWGFEEDSDVLCGSATLQPTVFDDPNDSIEIQVGPKRGSKIQALALMNETMYIFKTDSIWVLTGTTPSSFSIQEVHPTLGVAARRSVVNAEAGIIFLSSEFEFVSFGGNVESTKILSYDIGIGGDYTKDLVPIINRDRMDQVCAIYHNHIYRCAFVENGEVQNNMEYCFNTINETDFFTRGNNVSCYFVWDRLPDKHELLTGRSDNGYMMFQYRGLNWDNQASSPTMPIKIQTKFVGTGKAENIRVRRVWLNASVLGASDINIQTLLDCRNAQSDATSDNFPTRGEYKALTNFLRTNSQTSITSRNIPRHANAKGQNFSLYINENINNRDLEFSSFECEVIMKNRKRSHRVGL